MFEFGTFEQKLKKLHFCTFKFVKRHTFRIDTKSYLYNKAASKRNVHKFCMMWVEFMNEDFFSYRIIIVKINDGCKQGPFDYNGSRKL